MYSEGVNLSQAAVILNSVDEPFFVPQLLRVVKYLSGSQI